MRYNDSDSWSVPHLWRRADVEPSAGKSMAEREGFEPSVGFLLHTLSKRAP